MHHEPPAAQIALGGRPRDANPSPGALRQRLYVSRRAKGWRSARVTLRAEEIAALCALGYLKAGELPDAVGLGNALGRLLDRLPPPERWPGAG
jgi:hypothetical protein